MKIFFRFLTLLALAAIVWYLFFKKADYIYQFKVKSSTGTIFYSILKWEKTNDAIRTNATDSIFYSTVVQYLTFKDKNYKLYWKVKAINDSISRVRVGIKQPESSIFNRVSAPFIKTDFTSETKTFLTDFKTMLDKNLSTFKVQVKGKTSSPAKKCICINAKASPEDKAKQMMFYYNEMNNYLLENNIQSDGYPMVVINKYDKIANRIDMDFCFPVKGIHQLSGHPQDIFLKEIIPKPALKAVFSGNYMFTQNAWFALFDYASKNAIQLSDEIVEVFNDNPHVGGNALMWNTEVYIPLSEPKL